MPTFADRGNDTTDLQNTSGVKAVITNSQERKKQEELIARERGVPDGFCIDCGDKIAPKRFDLGHRRCISCASNKPRPVAITRSTVMRRHR